MSKVLFVSESTHSGARGQLENAIEEAGIEDYDIYYLPAVEGKKKFGKGDLKLFSEEIEKEIDRRNCRYTMLLGNAPLQAVTGNAGITKRRGKPIEKDGVIYLPGFSPAFAAYDDGNMEILERDVKTFKEIMDFGGIPEERELNIRYVIDQASFKEMLRDLRGTVSFDIETNGLYPFAKDAKIITIGFGTKRNQWILPIRHHQSPWSRRELDQMVEEIDETIQDCFIVTHNGKFDMLWMREHFEVEWEIGFDTMLAHYILDENSLHGLKYLAMKLCGAVDWEIDKEEKQGNAPLLKIGKYHAHDLFYTRELRFVLAKMLREDKEVKLVYEQILLPCANLFVDIEYTGVCIDTTRFNDAEKVLRDQYNQALRDLRKYEPKGLVNAKGKPMDFNWGSTKQLAALLFGTPKEGVPYGLGLPVLDKTDAGNASCSESVIKRIDHPCAGALLRFREAKQQLSFFIDGWKPYLVKKEWEKGVYWFLHPSFKLHGTVTGRLSCENPNLQQVPRDPRIRTLITAPKGWVLIDADLSQIELRIAAELAGETAMIHAFKNNIDVHFLTLLRELERGHAEKDTVLSTAKRLSNEPVKSYNHAIEILLRRGPDAAQEIYKEWKELRKKAKAINFGYLYGMWWKKFKLYARDNYGVSVTDEEAQASRESFFTLYGEFENWHKRQRSYARKYGFVPSLAGRKRRLPAARSPFDTPQRREAERQAINSPVQSFANDINLMALLQLCKEFPRSIVRVVGTVHDAILLMVKEEYCKQVHDRLLEIMSGPELFEVFDITLDVPIEADANIGPWGAGVNYKKWAAANSNIKQKVWRDERKRA